jgi:hypothetical protein
MRQRQQQRGQIYIYVAVGLVFFIALIALVIDAGTMYYTRQKQHNVTDAAALAAARLLLRPEREAALEAATTYYRLNWRKGADQVVEERREGDTVFYRIDQDTVRITTPLEDDERKVEVVASHHSPDTFAQFFGFSGRPITATARATIYPAGAVGGPTDGMVPWVMAWEDVDRFEEDQEYTLRTGPLGEETGNFRPLALGGAGVDNYRNNLINGFRQRVRTDDMVDLETADVLDATVEALNQRIADRRRVVVFAVTRTPDPGASGPVEVQGFAAFYLREGAMVDGGRVLVPAIYVRDALRGSDPDPQAPLHSNVLAVTLIQPGAPRFED